MPQFYAKAEDAANRILDAFQAGNLPAALAPVFIRRKDDAPCRLWSWSNQLLVVLAGHSDARGFRQWEAVKRRVKKGERSFRILAPVTKTITDTDEDTGDEVKRPVVVGFKGVPVFGLEQTDGEPLPPPDPTIARWVQSLPLADVARAWGLSIDTYSGRPGAPQGVYAPKRSINLGTQNLATWAHELIHAADDRCIGGLDTGQHLDQEIVAELGGAVLLEVVGLSAEADRGGCWEYLRHYAKKHGQEPIVVCQRLVQRTCEAVSLILDTAERLKSGEAAEAIESPAEAVA